MQPLNIQPSGLLGFLQLKQGGGYPKILTDTLIPQLELLRWYVAANCTEISSVSPAFQLVAGESTTSHQVAATTPVDLCGLAGTPGQLQVPNTEYWWIDRWSVNWTINAQAGASIRVDMVTTPAGGSSSVRVPASYGGYDTSDATFNRNGHATMIDPIILRPGTILALLCAGAVTAAAGINVNTQIRIARLTA